MKEAKSQSISRIFQKLEEQTKKKTIEHCSSLPGTQIRMSRF